MRGVQIDAPTGEARTATHGEGLIFHGRADARREAVRIHLCRIAGRDMRTESTRWIDAPAVIGARISLALLHAAVHIHFTALARADCAVHIQRSILRGGVADLAVRTARIVVAIRGVAPQILCGEIHEAALADAETIVGCQLAAAAVALRVLA